MTTKYITHCFDVECFEMKGNGKVSSVDAFKVNIRLVRERFMIEKLKSSYQCFPVFILKCWIFS